LSPFGCGLSGAPGCVTWELILDGYSESSYSATPRFAAARLPWFFYPQPKCLPLLDIASQCPSLRGLHCVIELIDTRRDTLHEVPACVC
ncbi:hypothetical protein MZG88_23190, partial [Escherichia coli]|nr:hypothetical protein [Escherichia coli]